MRTRPLQPLLVPPRRQFRYRGLPELVVVADARNSGTARITGHAASAWSLLRFCVSFYVIGFGQWSYAVGGSLCLTRCAKKR